MPAVMLGGVLNLMPMAYRKEWNNLNDLIGKECYYDIPGDYLPDHICVFTDDEASVKCAIKGFEITTEEPSGKICILVKLHLLEPSEYLDNNDIIELAIDGVSIDCISCLPY